MVASEEKTTLTDPAPKGPEEKAAEAAKLWLLLWVPSLATLTRAITPTVGTVMVMVMVAEADLVLSATEVAVKVTVAGLGAMAGAV